MTSPSKAPLFRTQAIEHIGIRHYGTIVMARVPSFAVLTAFFIAIAIGLVAFFIGFSYTRKAQVAGVLLPSQGMVKVVVAQSGVIAERRVREGQAVESGDVLFVLTSERASATRGDAAKTISTLLQTRRDSLQTERMQQRQQAAQRIEAARRRSRDLADDIKRIEDQRTLQLRRVALTVETVKRYTDLQASNFISSAQLQDRTAEMLDQQQRLTDLERAKASSERELGSVQADLQDLLVQADRDQQVTKRNIAAIEQDLTENEARREVWVRAPQAGIVTGITAERGQTIASGQSLAIVLPADPTLEAQLFAPSRSAGFIKAGMIVLLRYQAYPYQKFGQYRGLVREVSSTALHPDEMALTGVTLAGGGTAEPSLYRIRVSLERQTVQAYGTTEALKSGMAVDASILLERRRLYEWVLDPLYSITGRV